jgi:hypothetical protein
MHLIEVHGLQAQPVQTGLEGFEEVGGFESPRHGSELGGDIDLVLRFFL